MRKAGSFQPFDRGERLVLLLIVTRVIHAIADKDKLWGMPQLCLLPSSGSELHAASAMKAEGAEAPWGVSQQRLSQPVLGTVAHFCPLFQMHWTVSLLYRHCFLGKSADPQMAA